MSVACCLLFVAYFVLSAVCRLLHCCTVALLSVACCVLHVVCCLLRIVRCVLHIEYSVLHGRAVRCMPLQSPTGSPMTMSSHDDDECSRGTHGVLTGYSRMQSLMGSSDFDPEAAGEADGDEYSRERSESSSVGSRYAAAAQPHRGRAAAARGVILRPGRSAAHLHRSRRRTGVRRTRRTWTAANRRL